MSDYSFDEINDITGFANGDMFEDEQQVREYFTIENMEDMFGHFEYEQEDLDEMAEDIIVNKYHLKRSD